MIYDIPWGFFITTIIACLAVWIGKQQAKAATEQLEETRTYNRLSARPILNFNIRIERGPSLFELMLVNNGIGPAIITETHFHRDGEPIAPPGNESEWKKLFVSLLGTDVGRIKSFGLTYRPDYAIAVGVSETIIKLHSFKGESSDSPFFVCYQRVNSLSHATNCRKSRTLA